MNSRIRLTDIDRPNEPLDVDIERATDTVLRVIVPNTVIHFDLRRREGGAFEGALGGRYFVFDPNVGAKIQRRANSEFAQPQRRAEKPVDVQRRSDMVRSRDSKTKS